MAWCLNGQPDVAADCVASALFYLVAYAFTNFAAWSVVIALERARSAAWSWTITPRLGREIPACAGGGHGSGHAFLHWRPTDAGLRRQVLPLPHRDTKVAMLALAFDRRAHLAVSAYYYLRVVVIMYMREGEPEVRREPWLQLSAYAMALVCGVEHLLSAAVVPGGTGGIGAVLSRAG